MITARSLIEIMPHVPRARAKVYAKHLNKAMLEGNITTKRRAAFFLAQLAHESGDLNWMEEFASGAAYEGRRDLGNTHPGDGKRYKGRGPIQLTGRNNYIAAGKALKVDLVNHPTRAADPRYAFRIAVWFWTTRGLNAVADRGDFKAVTRIINGGYNGLADRQARLSRVRAVKASRRYLPATAAQRLARRTRKR